MNKIRVGSRVEWRDAPMDAESATGTVMQVLPPIVLIDDTTIPANRAFIVPDDGRTLGGIRRIENLEIVGFNKWLNEDKMQPFTELPDGTKLYPAYDPLGPGDTFRRGLSSNNGAGGVWVGVTLAGQLYRQQMLWGNSEPEPQKWEQFSYDAEGE